MIRSTSHLANKTCVPCKGNIPPLKENEITKLFQELQNGWQVINNHHLEKKYTFANSQASILFTTRIWSIAEKEGHHPILILEYNAVTLRIWTHKIGGLTESDFILAAKCDKEDLKELVDNAQF